MSRAIAPMRREASASDAEQAYADAMWEYENMDEDANADELIGNLYKACNDYVYELQERLEEREGALEEVRDEAYTVIADDLRVDPATVDTVTAYDAVRSIGGLVEDWPTLRELDSVVERWHTDHHTGRPEHCWEGVCAYVNGLENIAYMRRGA